MAGPVAGFCFALLCFALFCCSFCFVCLIVRSDVCSATDPKNSHAPTESGRYYSTMTSISSSFDRMLSSSDNERWIGLARVFAMSFVVSVVGLPLLCCMIWVYGRKFRRNTEGGSHINAIWSECGRQEGAVTIDEIAEGVFKYLDAYSLVRGSSFL